MITCNELLTHNTYLVLIVQRYTHYCWYIDLLCLDYFVFISLKLVKEKVKLANPGFKTFHLYLNRNQLLIKTICIQLDKDKVENSVVETFHCCLNKKTLSKNDCVLFICVCLFMYA